MKKQPERESGSARPRRWRIWMRTAGEGPCGHAVTLVLPPGAQLEAADLVAIAGDEVGPLRSDPEARDPEPVERRAPELPAGRRIERMHEAVVGPRIAGLVLVRARKAP